MSIPKDGEERKTIAEGDIRSFLKRFPRLYYSIATLFGPLMYGGLSAEKFLVRYGTQGKVLNIGSGPRVITPEVVNVDIHPYPGVHLVMRGNAVPLGDSVVSRIISETVLEHVEDPKGAVKEMHRLLVSGGYVYATLPFLYPFHSSPNDFQRWSIEGFKELFCEFEVVEVGVRAGPFSALTAYINHLFSILFSFGFKRLASVLLNMVMFITFPIKFLDIIFNHWPHAEEVSAVLFLVARKK